MLKCILTAGQRMQIIVYDGEITLEAQNLLRTLVDSARESAIIDIGLRDLALQLDDVYSDGDIRRIMVNDSLRIRIEGTLVKKEPIKYIVKPFRKEN